MRKYYIDNIRILCILMLFPFHTAMIFNGLGFSWYVHSDTNLVIADILKTVVYPWWMSGLFALAGISTVYALRHRTMKEYAKERVLKLLVPFMSAIIFVVPVQSYIADKFFYGYKGSYLEHLNVFFSLTNWNGYDGHFTPGQTWFILYLFIISMVFLPLIIWYKNKQNKINGNSLTMEKIIPMFLLLLTAKPILDIGKKSIGEFAVCFLLGYFILSEDEVQKRLERYCIQLGVAWIILMVIRYFMYFIGGINSFVLDFEYELLSWIGILAMLGLGKRFLDFNNKFRKYFVQAEFPIYIFHQSIIVVMGYFVVNYINNAISQYFLILITSFILTMIIYEICKRISVTRFLFAIKKSK